MHDIAYLLHKWYEFFHSFNISHKNCIKLRKYKFLTKLDELKLELRKTLSILLQKFQLVQKQTKKISFPIHVY